MPLFDFELFFDADDEFSYMPAGRQARDIPVLYAASGSAPYSRDVGLQHLAFALPTRQGVQEAHRTALSLGSQEVHAPQDWPQYPPPHFAAFWLDRSDSCWKPCVTTTGSDITA